MEGLFTTENLVSLLTLTFLEIILGIDNVVFISLLVDRSPQADKKKVRTVGIGLALAARLLLLACVGWLMSFQKPLFSIANLEISVHDMILLAGGLFLIAKSTSEIHRKIEGEQSDSKTIKKLTFRAAIVQIVLIDLVFSFDSILTAIGLVDHIIIIVIAIIISLVVMLAFVQKIGDFINKHPAMKLLAISFLFMIGTLLVIEALHFHVPRGYIYFAMAFSMIVEMLNMRIRKTGTKPRVKGVESEPS
jgi:predicted tellurium resistance membrane protein TerC